VLQIFYCIIKFLFLLHGLFQVELRSDLFLELLLLAVHGVHQVLDHLCLSFGFQEYLLFLVFQIIDCEVVLLYFLFICTNY
jgi:hypothetical protein